MSPGSQLLHHVLEQLVQGLLMESKLWHSKARSRSLSNKQRRNCETSLDSEVFGVTWGAIRAICH